MERMMVFLTASLLVMPVVMFGETPGDDATNVTDIAIGQTSEHEIRFTSGKTVYVEALVDGQWLGRSWSADGRAKPTDRVSSKPAFDIAGGFDWVMASPSNPIQLADNWNWGGATELPKTQRGSRHLVVELSNRKYPVNLKIHTLLNGTPVLVRWLEITNTGSGPFKVTSLAPWSGKLWPWTRPTAYEIGYQTGNRLGWFEWRKLSEGLTKIESTKGTGYDDPFFIARDEANSEYFICHLAWSANWGIEFDYQRDFTRPEAGLSFKIGPVSVDPLRVISAGQTVQTPAVHLGHLRGDFDDAVYAMHTHLRNFVLPARKPEHSYLIQYSVPRDNPHAFYRGDDYTEENLKKCIDVAAALGSELFIVDFGWWDIYGQWEPSPEKFPKGMDPVRNYAHEKGLLFGLYFEVEGGRGNWAESKLYKEHPDWFGPRNVLRLDKPEVAAYLENELERLIKKYQFDLYRHDFIPGYTFEWVSQIQDRFTENRYWRYYENYYAIWDRIRAKYPDLILQMCCNGGTREDIDMMSRFHESYSNEGTLHMSVGTMGTISADNYYALPPMAPAYSGKTVALPPEVLVYGVQRNFQPLDTLLRVMFTLSTPWIIVGPAPNLEELTPETQQLYLHYADIYKNFIRPMWPAVKVYHHEPVNEHGGVESSTWWIMEFAAPDKTKCWATIIRMMEENDTYTFKPRGLSPCKNYKVTFDSKTETKVISGFELMVEGLDIKLESALSSELLLFEAE